MKAANAIYRNCQHGEECSPFADLRAARIAELEAQVGELKSQIRCKEFDSSIYEHELEERK